MSENCGSSGEEEKEEKEEKATPRLTRRTAARGDARPPDGGLEELLRGATPPGSERRFSLLGSAEKSAAPRKGLSSSENVIRVGEDFQARLPEYAETVLPARYASGPATVGEEKCVWAPAAESREGLDDFLAEAAATFLYTEEQALGILFLHDYDAAAALADLANYTPARTDWSLEEKVAFEQAFSLHGKFFARIRSMMPNKTIAQLVDHYYSWKQQRKYSSYFDTAHQDADDAEAQWVFATKSAVRPECGNCGQRAEPSGEGPPSPPPNSVSRRLPPGTYCLPCRLFFSRTGTMRKVRKLPRIRPRKFTCPPNMQLSYDGLMCFLEEPKEASNGRGESYKSEGAKYLDQVDHRVAAAKRTAGRNFGDLMRTYRGLQRLEVARGPRQKEAAAGAARRSQTTWAWSKTDERLVVQGFRYYGKDFESIARVVETKTAEQVKAFYRDYAARWSLDKLVESCETERKRRKEELKATKETANEAITIDSDSDGEPPCKIQAK